VAGGPKRWWRLAGRVWLEFEVEPTDRGNMIPQTAAFDPSGLLGLVYWYGIDPLHAVVFRGMLAGIARAARQELSGARARKYG
jgi:hypothetical protein